MKCDKCFENKVQSIKKIWVRLMIDVIKRSGKACLVNCEGLSVNYMLSLERLAERKLNRWKGGDKGGDNIPGRGNDMCEKPWGKKVVGVLEKPKEKSVIQTVHHIWQPGVQWWSWHKQFQESG